MEQSPSWEANRFSASEETPPILWTPNVHYGIHKCPPPVSILSQFDPVHTPHPTSWRSILILSYHPRLGLPSGLLPSGLPTKILCTPLLSPIRVTCPAPLILDLVTRTILGEEYRSWVKCSWFASKPVLRWGVVNTTPNPQAGGPSLGCLRLLIQYTVFATTLPSILEAICKLRTHHALVTGTHSSRR